jgi:hypothetical protein
MIYKNYTNLSITSAKKPYNNSLFWEHSTYGLLLVDSTSQDKLLISTDKGDNWTDIDLTGATTKKIQAGWLDGNDLWLVTCDNPDNVFTVIYVELDNSNNVVDVGDSANQDAGTVYAMDIFDISGTKYICALDDDSATSTTGISFYTSGAMGVPDLRLTTPGISETSYGVVVGTDYWCLNEIGTNLNVMKYDPGVSLTVPDLIANYRVNSDRGKAWMAYDGSNILYALIEKTADSTNWIATHNISGGSFELQEENDIIMMLNRNSSSQEKGFHITEYKVYQLHSKLAFQTHLIAKPDTGEVIVGITDNYLITTTGKMFEYEDVEAYVMECLVRRGSREVPSGTISLSTYSLEAGMLIRIEDMFTTATVSASQIIFEGFIETFSQGYPQAAILISPAQKDLEEEFPSGEYSGRTDEIIVSLIAAHCDYITGGTMSNGMAMGTIEFLGDKSFREILDEFALQDDFIWYLTPTGELYYNNGTVDSGENFTASSSIWDVRKTYGMRAINYVDIKGGFVSGSQVSGTVAEDTADKRLHGRIPYERTFSHLDLAAQCTSTNTNILARLGTQPIIVPFTHVDTTVGLIQEGETVTFEYNVTNPNISSDQFLILSSIYNAKQGKASYRISDQVI